MAKKKYQEQLRTYFDGEMSRSDRKAFEAELDQNKELQKNFFIYAMQKSKTSSQDEQKIRAIVDRFREKMGPLPVPRLTWLDRLRFFLHDRTSWLKWLWVMIIFGISGLVISVNLTLKPLEDLIEQYHIGAYCYDVAGDNNSNEGSFYPPSKFYCNYQIYGPKGIDSLQIVAAACNDFCLARYYLAHGQLRNGAYSEAENGFLECLDRQEELLQLMQPFFKPQTEAIQYNLYLSQLGRGFQRKEIVARLNNLLQNPAISGTFRLKLERILNELEHPLRFLVIK